MKKLTHTDQKGRASMVDVGDKPHQHRKALAEGFITLSPETIILIKESRVKKGDVLSISEFAGIQAGKKCSELIPLCHPLLITKLDVAAELQETGVKVSAKAECIGQTGIEMEALTSVSIALLTIYDMCKAADKKMIIGDIRLVSKEKNLCCPFNLYTKRSY